MEMQYDQVKLYQEAYIRNKLTLEKSGMSVNDMSQANTIRMAKSVIRTEVYAQPGATEFTFPILPNDPSPGNPPVSTPTITEVRLKQQDVFFCCELGFFIYVQTTSGGSTQWRYVDMTFPDPFLNGGAWSGGSNINLPFALWTAARLNVLVNNVALTPLYPIKRHMYVPEGQVVADAKFPPSDASGGGHATSWENSFNQVDYSQDGYCSIWPNWIINGGNNNQYTLQFPTPISNLGIATGANLWFVLEFHGYLAQNASSIMSMNKNK